jgi:hypothetical protein
MGLTILKMVHSWTAGSGDSIEQLRQIQEFVDTFKG